MNEITVSIILLTYNQEKYLETALQSILEQNVDFNYEIIVADDFSTDRSRNIIMSYQKKYPDLFVLSFQKVNMGGTRNYYDACIKAKGKYIATIEGDDYWIDSGKLKKQVAFLENNAAYIGVSHLVESRGLNNELLGITPSNSLIVGKDATMELFLNGIYFSFTATLYRNIFLDKTKDYTIIYKAARLVADLTNCLLLLSRGKIHVLDIPMAVYRVRCAIGETNYNSIRNPEEKCGEHFLLLERLDSYFHQEYDLTNEYVKHFIAILGYGIKSFKFKMLIKFYLFMPRKAKLRVLIKFPKVFFCLCVKFLRKCM